MKRFFFDRKTFILENILKKKRSNTKEQEDKARAKVLSRKSNKAKKIKKEKILLPDHFVRKYKANQASYQRLKRRVPP